MEQADLEQWKAREVARLLALVEAERRYFQEIIAAAPVGLLVLSADLSVVSANREIRKIFGFRSGESVRGRPDKLFPKWVLDRIQQVQASGKEQAGILAETRLNGGRSLRLGIQTIQNWSEEGEQEILVIVEDITDLPGAAIRPVGAVAQPALEPVASRKGEPLLPDLFDHLEPAIWVAEIPSMRFRFVNEQGGQLLGFHPGYWLDAADFWRERIHPDDRESVVESYQAAIVSGAGCRRVAAEYRAIRADNRLIWVYDTARIVLDTDGRARWVAGVSIDVTERRQLEDHLVRGNRANAVGKLAGRLAHDLNNILMIVSGYAEELLHGLPAGSPLNSDVREILQATDRITVLTNQMLAFTRYQTTASATIELNAVLQGMDRGLRDALGPKIALEAKLAPEPLAVRVELAQLHQVIAALVRHAHEAMPDGGRLTIGVARTAFHADLRRPDATIRAGPYVAITVRDTGRQYDAETRAAMFESFLPAKESTEDAGPALARAFALVRQWGGDISVANAPVSGSIFQVLLPLASFDAPALGSPEAEMQEPALSAPRGETILVVEDEAGIRALIAKILRRQGYEVLETESGARALEACRDHQRPIDLVISDVVMPEMSGSELVSQLRAQRHDLKVLYISGYTDDPAIYAELLPPDTAYLQKPFTLGSLLDKVKEVLAGKS